MFRVIADAVLLVALMISSKEGVGPPLLGLYGDIQNCDGGLGVIVKYQKSAGAGSADVTGGTAVESSACLLYTSDAADE